MFGLSSHYLWDAGSVIVDNKTNRRVSTQAAYDVKGTDFINSVKTIITLWLGFLIIGQEFLSLF
jgi:hypothetical protein